MSGRLRKIGVVLGVMGASGFWGCRGEGQSVESDLVVSSDAALGRVAASFLPDLVRRSGMELEAPVRIERRTREELAAYLTRKLDEEFPEEQAGLTRSAYALFGLVSPDTDLRATLHSLYTEQVAGFYEPDSAALFLLDDQPKEMVEGVLLHELVHAVQDQTADLKALTDDSLGNDRKTAAHAAIEGHAMLVMMEFVAERAQGREVDLGAIDDFAGTLRPAMEGMAGEFPALSNAPEVLRASLLFPYLEGTSYVQRLWHATEERTNPFEDRLPLSTEQVMTGDLTDVPVHLDVEVPRGGTVLESDGLGRLEVEVLLRTHAGESAVVAGTGWGGDRYVLVESDGGRRSLVWYSVWDSERDREEFVEALAPHLASFPAGARMERVDVDGLSGVRLEVGDPPPSAARRVMGSR